MNEYAELKRRLAHGWNTWNTRSVLSHVLLPQGFAVNLGIKEYASGKYLKEALIGRFGDDEEQIHPGAHAYDASYTELNLKWRGIEIVVESAVVEDDLVLLVTPVKNQMYPPTLVIETGMLWNRPGALALEGERVKADLPTGTLSVYTTGEPVKELNIPTQAPYLAVKMDQAVGVSVGKERSLSEIQSAVRANREEHVQRREIYGELAETYNALQSCMAWDTIYEPQKDRVVTPVSRIWNIKNGGYVLFCWDNYFAAYLASLDSKDLAYANAVEMTREATPDGFVPNCAWGTGFSSLDRSQPPVGSMVVRELYRKYREKWLVDEVFADLYKWNTWFIRNREVEPGLMAWGSTPYGPKYGNHWETAGVNDTFGGALESGLDNSPMYDDIPFDQEKHCMKLADVGLTGLCIMDCRALAELADVLGKADEAKELRARAANLEQGLQTLWDEQTGFFLNKRTDTGQFSHRISPTNFYALFGSSVTPNQAERIISEHFYNPEEFWGEWIMPSIARNDPAYPDQNYWRGRIWAPMNFLVYLGLRNHCLEKAQQDLADKSQRLLLKEWLELGHVHENYCANTGSGCGVSNSDKFYHWGSLLALITLIEAGYVEGPEKPLEP